MKDIFSEQAALYAQFRPVYPDALVREIASMCPARQAAWDCGTGNGQLALLLSEYFEQVVATDISEEQIAQASLKANITYQVEPAEHTTAPDQAFDLVTVAQAIHWFDFDLFYREVRRVLRPEGLLAVIGYGLCRITPELNILIDKFYSQTIGPYWDSERRYIDQSYQTIPFPLEEVTVAGQYRMEYNWSLEAFTSYLRTWSAVRQYQRAKQKDPVLDLEEELRPIWGDTTHLVRFPLLLRAGRV